MHQSSSKARQPLPNLYVNNRLAAIDNLYTTLHTHTHTHTDDMTRHDAHDGIINSLVILLVLGGPELRSLREGGGCPWLDASCVYLPTSPGRR